MLIAKLLPSTRFVLRGNQMRIKLVGRPLLPRYNSRVQRHEALRLPLTRSLTPPLAPQAFLFILFAINSANLSAADEHIFEVRTLPGRGLGQKVQPAADFQLAERQLAAAYFDPRAEKLMQAAEAYSKGLFGFKTMQRETVVTNQSLGDVLVSKWNVDGPAGHGSVILEDTPVASIYHVRLTGLIIKTPADIPRFLQRLFAYEPPAQRLRSGSLTVESPAGVPEVLEFSVDTTGILFKKPGITDFYIAARGSSREWFITVRIAKGNLEDAYPAPPFVAERFPPLAELLPNWTEDRIIAEIGKNIGDGKFGNFSFYRDAILFTELVRRELPPGRMLELLRASDWPTLRNRANLMVEGVGRSGRNDVFGNYFAPALSMYEGIGPPSREAVDILFHAAALRCAASYESHAWRLLEKSTFGEEALLYLSRCSLSAATVQRLSELHLDSAAAAARDAAVARMRGRLISRW